MQSGGIAVVQGASRGLGLQFCRHILQANTAAKVLATCRNPETATPLLQLKDQYSDRFDVLKVDVTQESDIEVAATHVKNSHGKVDLLLNCAALLHPSGRGETSLAAVNQQDLQAVYATNTIGPLLMAKHFKPLLQKGDGNFGSQENKKKHAAIVANISARVSSISDNGLGGWYAYRMSKCALNMATRNLSIELERGKSKVVCVVLHPGTVETDLSRPYHKGVPKDKLFTAEYSVSCLMDVVKGLEMSKTGQFFAWDGSAIPY